MAKEGKSGKRVVAVLLGLVALAVIIASFASKRIQNTEPAPGSAAADASGAPSVLSEGVLYETRAGDPALVIARDVGSGKELWRAELGAIATQPVVLVREEVVEVRIAGTPWMTLDRSSGEPVEE